MFVGAALKDEPEVGVIELDAASGNAWVNGRTTDLTLAGYLRDWVAAELTRKGLQPTWLQSATVHVRYRRTPRTSGESPWADFKAEARVVSDVGETTGTFSNSQHLVDG